MKPFNLEEALKGAKVVTRDGREISEIHKFEKTKKDAFRIAVVRDGMVKLYSDEGKTIWLNESCDDLFMAPTERKEWLVRASKGMACALCKTKEEAYAHYLIDQGGTIHEITIQELNIEL
jgi:hypothetical protein